MKKYILFLILIISIKTGAFAQQSALFSQYMFNEFVINPAIAGTHDYYQIRLNNRYQWVGIDNAPITAALSVYGPHNSKPMGWGGYLYTDSQGPTSKMGIYGAYGYNIVLKNDLNLSMGLNIGLIQYKIDPEKIEFLEDEDPTFIAKKYSYIKPDATVGLYLYSTRLFAGFSADQLFNNKIEVEKDTAYTGNATFSRLKTHFTLVGGYKFNLNRDFDMEPSMLFRAVTRSPLQVEITVRTIFRKMAWLGVSFRSSDAVALMLGYNYKDQIYIGYSYDITYSKLRYEGGGSHEIMIGARFNKIRNSRAKF
ncbi:MAG: type IX secretion system membrane protein PorP/SprF [Bacteroidales bacterium]|nr:type IX secretion system membrane protein PorP/SprF [Bacteroidales bacterium]